jgi:hypothetical protein
MAHSFTLCCSKISPHNLAPCEFDVSQPSERLRILDRQCEAKGEFAQALWLCAQSLAWVQDAGSLKVAEPLIAGLQQRRRETSSLLRLALQRTCADFTSEAYAKVRVVVGHPSCRFTDGSN